MNFFYFHCTLKFLLFYNSLKQQFWQLSWSYWVSDNFRTLYWISRRFHGFQKLTEASFRQINASVTVGNDADKPNTGDMGKQIIQLGKKAVLSGNVTTDEKSGTDANRVKLEYLPSLETDWWWKIKDQESVQLAHTSAEKVLMF